MPAGKLLGLGAALLCLGAPAFAQDCGPPRPSQPVNTEVADKTKADANVLLKSLGSGAIENDYRRIQADVLSQYPNADRVHVWDSFVYMLCTLLRSSPSLSEAEKLDRYQVLVDTWRTERPSPGEQASGATQSGGVSIGTLHQESHGAMSPPIGNNSGTVTIQGGPTQGGPAAPVR